MAFIERCKHLFHSLWGAVESAYRKFVPTPIVEPAPAVKPLEAEKPLVVTAPKPKSLKNEILDNLDTYFKYINRMRKTDRESYDLYKHIGGQFVSSHYADAAIAFGEWNTVPTRWKTVRPAFGCVLFPVTHDETEELKDDITYPRFIYFRKLAKPSSDVQRAPEGWDVYTVSMTMAFHNQQFTIDAAVALNPDNQCRALMVKYDDSVTIHTKRGSNRGYHTIHRQKWGVPPRIKMFVENKKITPEQMICDLFGNAAQFWELAQAQMVEVKATKGNVSARFNVTGDDTARLFKDRERIGNSKRRIFHAVRPHERGGKMIKMHFRGERQFTWNGYAISITVPGKDFAAYLPEFDAGGIVTDEQDVPADMLTAAQLGKKLSEYTSYTKH